MNTQVSDQKQNNEPKLKPMKEVFSRLLRMAKTSRASNSSASNSSFMSETKPAIDKYYGR